MINIMISKYSHKGLNWVDLKSPSEEEISHIIEQLSIPSHIEGKIKENKKPARPSGAGGEDIINIDEDFIFISLRGELIFIVNDKFILTIHSHPIQAFDNFSKEMELDIIVEEQSKIKNNKLLFAYLLKNLHLEKELKSITDNFNIRNLEEKIIKKDKKLKLFRFLSMIFLLIIIILLCL